MNTGKDSVFTLNFLENTVQQGIHKGVIFMKGIIKRGSLRFMSFAAACLISVSDAGYTGTLQDVSAVTMARECSTWKQYDSRWGYLHLGKSECTVKRSGCAMTSLSFLLVKAGNFDERNFDPGVFCRLMSEIGGFGEYGDINWIKVNQIAPGFRFVGTHRFKSDTTYEERYGKIKSYLDDGYHVIIDVNDGGHWVAIDGIENDRLISFDPGGDRDTDVFRQYKQETNSCIKVFKSEFVTAFPPAVKYNYKKGTYAANTELNIRSAPYSSSEKLGTLPVGGAAEVYEIAGCWGKFMLDEEKPAWICLDYTDLCSPEAGITTVTVVPPVQTVPAVTEPSVTVTQRVTEPVQTTTVIQTTTEKVTTTATEKITTVTAPEVTSEKADYKTGSYRTAAYLNYRKSADVESERYGVFPPETELNIYEVSGSWGRTVYDGKDCWICLDYTKYLGSSFKEETPAVTEAPAVTTVPVTTETSAVTTVPVTTTVTEPVTTAVTSDTALPDTGEKPPVTESGRFRCRTTAALNYRKGPGTEHEIMCVIPKETVFEVYEFDEERRWGMVKYDGKSGWICLDYVVPDEISSAPSETDPAEEKPVPEEPAVSEKPSGSAVTGIVRSEPDETGILRGDTDGNGFINVLDFIRLRSCFEGNPHPVEPGADVNADGIISIHDLIALGNMFVSADRN